MIGTLQLLILLLIPAATLYGCWTLIFRRFYFRWYLNRPGSEDRKSHPDWDFEWMWEYYKQYPDRLLAFTIVVLFISGVAIEMAKRLLSTSFGHG